MNFKPFRSVVLSTMFLASAAGLSFAQEQGLPLPAEQQKRRALDPLEQKEEARKAEARERRAELDRIQKELERKKRELLRIQARRDRKPGKPLNDRKPVDGRKPGKPLNENKPVNNNKPITQQAKPTADQAQEEGSFQQLRDLGSRLGEQILSSFNERMPVDTAEARERTAEIAQSAWEGLQQRAQELQNQQSQGSSADRGSSNTEQQASGQSTSGTAQRAQSSADKEKQQQSLQHAQKQSLLDKQELQNPLDKPQKAQDKQVEVPSLEEVQRLASRIGRSIWREVMARVDDATPGITLAEARRRGERMAHGLGRKLSMLARWGQVNGVVEVDGEPVKLSVDRDGNAIISGPQGTQRVQLDEEQMRQVQDALVRSQPGRGEGFGVMVGDQRRSADGEALQTTLQGIAQAALTPAQQQTDRRGGGRARRHGGGSLPASARREQEDFGQRQGARQRLSDTTKKK